MVLKMTKILERLRRTERRQSIVKTRCYDVTIIELFGMGILQSRGDAILYAMPLQCGNIASGDSKTRSLTQTPRYANKCRSRIASFRDMSRPVASLVGYEGNAALYFCSASLMSLMTAFVAS